MTLSAAAMAPAAARLPSFAALALALMVITGGARAGQPMYVIEQLVVGVNSAPAGAGDRVATLRSGDPVEVLARQGDEAQIQLPNGASGWVKASYLSAELPLQRRLQEQTAELDKLRQEVTRLHSAASGAPPATPAGAGGSTAAQGEDSPAGAPQGTAVRDPSPFMGAYVGDAKPSWLWVLACSAVTLALGFFIGWRMLDRRIRRKYGGLRIY